MRSCTKNKKLLLLVICGIAELLVSTTMSAQPYRKKLSKEEERVIVNKGTEMPFSGKYNDFSEEGAYYCKRCDTKLYKSSDKFSSACGWPSFDDEIEGAVKRQVDIDGRRTEILCANCGAHLGHVFAGERLTDKNVRHCVNSISLVFKPIKKNLTEKTAYFAGGCFWGVEYLFEQKEGVISALSGYMGGVKEKPSYQDISQGNTGYFETVKVVYDPKKTNYEKLAKFFFEIHDPTQKNGQGPDIGKQYMSIIFCDTDAEKKTALALIEKLEKKGYKVATKILNKSTFWKAEEYHQNYYNRKKQTPYCHRYEKRF